MTFAMHCANRSCSAAPFEVLRKLFSDVSAWDAADVGAGTIP